jgi:ABC-type polysaccharide/polyol phosphate export permease
LKSPAPPKEALISLDSGPEPLSDWITGMWRYRGVFMALAQKDFKVRYKRATLGVLWAVALPILQSAVMVFVFSRISRFGGSTHYSYAGFVLAGMVPWIYVSTAISSSTTSIVDGAGLADKVWFPRGLLALVPVASNIITLGISLFVLIVVLPFLHGGGIHLRELLFIPAAVLVIMFAASVGLLLSASYVYFRDMKFAVMALILVWFYVTPIFYPQSALHSVGRLLDFNPLTGIVGLFQRAAVGAAGPSLRALVISIGTTLVLLVISVGVQRHFDRRFVDLL